MTHDPQQSSRPEGAFVLLIMQATFWVGAGISAFPFALAGEPFMVLLGAASLLLASFACLLAIGLVRRWRRARRWTIALESVCVASSLLLLAVPLGANHGPVSLLVNVALPVVVIALLRGKEMRAAFAGWRDTKPGPPPGSTGQAIQLSQTQPAAPMPGRSTR